MIRDTKEGFVPSTYLVICHALMTKENGHDGDYVGKYNTHRVGAAPTIKACKELIDDDLKAMSDTMGGIFSPVSTKGRSYQVFKATWEEISIK